MRDRLPAQYFAALESRSALKRGGLHKAVLELVISYKQRFEIVFPPLNAPLIFFKYVRDLCLPCKSLALRNLYIVNFKVDMYAAARKLGRILEMDFSFPSTFKRHLVTANPEVQIISLIIIATKLCQPFDDIVRNPENVTDPSGLRLNWEAWSKIMAEKPLEGLKKGQEINVTDGDIFKMNGKELDDYLDWYQRTWVDSSDPKSKSTSM